MSVVWVRGDRNRICVTVGDVGGVVMRRSVCRVWGKRTSVIAKCANSCKTSGKAVAHVWKSKRASRNAKDGGKVWIGGLVIGSAVQE